MNAIARRAQALHGVQTGGESGRVASRGRSSADDHVAGLEGPAERTGPSGGRSRSSQGGILRRLGAGVAEDRLAVSAALLLISEHVRGQGADRRHQAARVRRDTETQVEHDPGAGRAFLAERRVHSGEGRRPYGPR